MGKVYVGLLPLTLPFWLSCLIIVPFNQKKKKIRKMLKISLILLHKSFEVIQKSR